MRKFLIGVGILLVLVILFLVFGRKYYTKRFSPEDHAELVDGDFNALVFYNRPYKKGRQIFGALVPYGKVWRTGANEATTFETNKDIEFENQKLKKGKYSLWTIPGEETWTIIFNSEYGQWGIGPGGDANRDPEKDVLKLDVRSVQSEREFEQFTISFEKTGAEAEMVLIWDKTLVA